MNAFLNIEQKLSFFYKKYYTNELIKGSLLFSLLGVLYFIFTIYVEYFLWLQPTYRTILFLLFIFIEFFLFFKFIITPITQLIKLKKGINEIESSKIIGNHFPEVQDKLLNILQLKKEQKETDLILASIQQKSLELLPVQFTKAVDFKKNVLYLKYLIFPIFIWLLSSLSGIDVELYNSLTRVVNPKAVFVPPAPFSFHLATENLRVIEGDSYTVSLSTRGAVVPEEVKVLYNKQGYLMQETAKGVFSFTFTNVVAPLDFQFQSGSVISKLYSLELIKTPLIQNLVINLEYPGYTKKIDEKVENTGNLVVPEGTKIRWDVIAYQSDSISFTVNKRRDYFFETIQNNFTYKKTVQKNMEYDISSSNRQLQDFEKLSYNLRVIVDEFPIIIVQSNVDSVNVENAQFAGQVSDDYGINTLKVIYYNQDTPTQKKSFLLDIAKATTQTFFYEFPKEIILEKGVDYELYFQVSDNDAIHGNKKTNSKKFKYRKQTNEEFNQEQLKDQKETIQNLENAILNQEQQKKTLQKIQQELQNKKDLNWSDKKKVDEFLRRQKQYEQMMERQTENLQQSLEQKTEETESLQNKKQQLKKRIEELLTLNKQKKLLDELQKMADKLNKEELVKKVKQLAQQNKQQERSLERILELTKRFYVEEKTLQIAKKLESLSKKQDSLKNNNKKALEEQEKIGNEFDEISKELEELTKDNEKLKEPMDIPQQQEESEEIKQVLSKSEENLQNKQEKSAQKSQKKASKKMQQMSQKMQQAISDIQENSIDENIEDLRKILENLITFSFKQEDLLVKFNEISVRHPDFGKELKNQNELKTYFEHIDDSLFVLSMRLPVLSSKIQTELSNTHYNLDASLENLSENRFDVAGSNQQYVMTAVNNLADLFSNLLNDMQNNMSASGDKGKGSTFSLPTLIEKQKGLSEQLKKGLKKKNGEKDGGKGKKEGEKGGNKFGEEQLNGELFKIYQQQNILRGQLKEALNQGSENNDKVKKVLKTMEQLENDILEKGFHQEIIQRMQQLEYELLKLDKAAFEQGKDKKRKSNTNSSTYQNKQLKEIQFKKQFYNQMEILNRQSLPLHQDFEKKVQKYFSKKIKE